MSVADSIKVAVIDDIKQIKAYQWIFLVLNIIFNGVVTIFAVLCLIPYAVELIIRSIDRDTPIRQVLMALLSNQPYLVLFTGLALLLSLFVPLYRRPWFLVVYRIVQSFVGWVVIAVGVATIMEAVRRLLISWSHEQPIWPTSVVSIVAGCMFILQGTGMFTTVFLSNILFHFFITKSVEADNVEKARNIFAKIIAAVLHGLEVIFAVILLIYSGFHVYLLVSDQTRETEMKVGEIVIFAVFCVCGVVSIISSCAGAIVYVVTCFVSPTSLIYPAVFFGVNLGECILFALIFCIIGVVIVAVSYSSKSPTNTVETDFFDSMWSIGILCLWKVLLAVSGVEVVFSNFRFAQSTGDDILNLKNRTSGAKSGEKKSKDIDLSV